jgi:hypothetical protein
MKLKNCISSLAFNTEYSDDEFNKYMENEVIYEYRRSDNIGWKEWGGKEKNVHVWWKLDNGYGVGMNENMSRGLKFVVRRIK